MTPAEEFDLHAFFDAVDARRRERQLSWPALATVILEQSRVLNDERKDHPISPTTIRKLAEGRGLSSQHSLFLLRWLGVPPETFIAAPQPGTAGFRFPWRTSRIGCVGIFVRSMARSTPLESRVMPPGSRPPIVSIVPQTHSPACALRNLPPASAWRCGLPRLSIAPQLTSSTSRNGNGVFTGYPEPNNIAGSRMRESLSFRLGQSRRFGCRSVTCCHRGQITTKRTIAAANHNAPAGGSVDPRCRLDDLDESRGVNLLAGKRSWNPKSKEPRLSEGIHQRRR